MRRNFDGMYGDMSTLDKAPSCQHRSVFKRNLCRAAIVIPSLLTSQQTRQIA